MDRNEIIEWGARRLFNLENESLWSRADELVKQKYIMEATVCMSHPDLYLMVDRILPAVPKRVESDTDPALAWLMGQQELIDAGWEPVIPIKED